ncbi:MULTISPECIES: hypothetical protein [unclassified Campylobacter]|uniref:hypothetical protein n=1 Tax=unclassified Campylobacter TaxID=2593542 RepID=UPI003D352313
MERSLCLLILLASGIWAEQLIFSAQVDVTNASLSRQAISITTSHIQLKNANFKYLCEIKNEDNNSDIEAFLNTYKEELLDCFILYKARVKSKIIKSEENVKKTLNLRVLPTRFIIDFKPKLAIIKTISIKGDR